MKNQKNNKEYQLVINEVDCYIGNSNRINRYAKDKAVQHQILLLDKKQNIHFIGRLNRVADDDRGSGIVLSKIVDKKVADLFFEAKKTESLLKYASKIEDIKKIKIYNKPILEKVKKFLKEIYLIENLGISFELFCRHILY